MLGSSALMLSLNNNVERSPLPARAHRYRPTIGLGREIYHARGLQRLRARTVDRNPLPTPEHRALAADRPSMRAASAGHARGRFRVPGRW